MKNRAYRWIRKNKLRIVAVAGAVVAWEVIATLVPESQMARSPIFPSLRFIITRSFLALSDYWTLDFLAPQPIRGGSQTYLGAFLALAYHSSRTLVRLVGGLSLGIVAGVGSGLVLSYWAIARRLAWAQLNFLRMVPLLAGIPLAQFWFGANTRGVIILVAYGAWVIMVVTTINAVSNVPDRYIESASTLGASRFQTYLTIVVPSSLPELRTSLLLSSGFSWSATIGAEYLGLRDGLGPILSTAATFTNTGRMAIVAAAATIYAWLAFRVLDRLAMRTMSWVPRLEDTRQTEEFAAGSLGAGLDTRATA